MVIYHPSVTASQELLAAWPSNTQSLLLAVSWFFLRGGWLIVGGCHVPERANDVQTEQESYSPPFKHAENRRGTP
jgi:hypothetical protein